MVRHLLVLVLSLVAIMGTATSSQADESESPDPESTTSGSVHAEANGLSVTASTSAEGSQTTAAQSTQPIGNTAEPVGKWVRSNEPCDTVGAAGCVEGYTCPDGSAPTVWMFMTEFGPAGSYSQCPEDPEPTAATPTVDIPGEVLAAFKKVDLPASSITVQPPGGETLVNFKTILSTQAERHQIQVRLDKVALNVVLEVWPSKFVWHHGDGTSQVSAIPGTPWTEGADVDGDGFITHVYTKELQSAPVSVDTTWSAQFKVAGAADWRPVNGTVSITGAPLTLDVREASPELVTDPN
ncbi:MAG: hypothetical protein JWN68_1144 [Nocardioides sp.]|nr:hypothetical protein [Nocardioides sp.]